MKEILSKLAVASAVIANLPELPGYNGSVLTIDDTEAARIAADLDEVHAALSEQTPLISRREASEIAYDAAIRYANGQVIDWEAEFSVQQGEAPTPDTGDTVLHKPSGEEWLVAFVENGRVCACGWPCSFVPLDDCTLVAKATSKKRQELLADMAGMKDSSDPRQRYAKRALSAQQAGTEHPVGSALTDLAIEWSERAGEDWRDYTEWTAENCFKQCADELRQALAATPSRAPASVQDEPTREESADDLLQTAHAFWQSERDAVIQAPDHCDLPPFGWRCTRAKGHEGPCAAVECPEDVAGVERGMKRWREGVARQEAGDTMDKWARNVIDAAVASDGAQAAGQDARDAARYRWLKQVYGDGPGIFELDGEGNPTHKILLGGHADAAIDAGMAAGQEDAS